MKEKYFALGLKWLLFRIVLPVALSSCAVTPGREQPLGYVVSTAFSPDGRILAVTTFEGEVALFDARPLWFQRVLTRKSDKVPVETAYSSIIGAMFRPRPLAFSLDGSLLAASIVSGSVAVWEVRSGAEKFRVPASSQISDIVFSPDGQTFVTAGPDVNFWSVRDGERTGEIQLPRGAKATSAAISPDGQSLVVGLSTGEIALFDATSRTLLRMLKAHIAPVTGVAFQPDGSALASTAGGYDLRLWKRDPEKGFEKSAPPAGAAASAAGSIGQAQGAGIFLWLLGAIRGFQIVGAPTMGAPPIVAGPESQFANAARNSPFHCGSRVAFSGNGRYLVSTANLLKCPDCVGTLAPAFLMFLTELEKGATTTVRDLGCEVSIAPDGSIVAVGGPGAPEIRDSRTGQRLTEKPSRN